MEVDSGVAGRWHSPRRPNPTSPRRPNPASPRQPNPTPIVKEEEVPRDGDGGGISAAGKENRKSKGHFRLVSVAFSPLPTLYQA